MPPDKDTEWEIPMQLTNNEDTTCTFLTNRESMDQNKKFFKVTETVIQREYYLPYPSDVTERYFHRKLRPRS